MNDSNFKKVIFTLALFIASLSIGAQSEKGVLLDTRLDHPGYLLFAPLTSHSTLLVDKKGNVVHSWPTATKPAQSSVFLTKKGNLLRTAKDSVNKFGGHGGGIIERINWNGVVEWSYKISDENQIQHHDICLMPNGNILILVWQKKSPNEAIANGRNPALVGKEIWTEKILEIKPKGKDQVEIVWEWQVWNHLVQDFDASKKNYGNVSESPGLFNINFNASDEPDWLHFNGLAFNPLLNQIIVSSAHWNEFYIINHSTFKADKAKLIENKIKKSRDVLYRWGNPAAYNRGTPEDQKLFRQHDAHWVVEGNTFQNKIIVFNNGVGRMPELTSTIDMLVPPLNLDLTYYLAPGEAYGPEKLCWQYNPDEEEERFYARNMSGAQRLANGHILVSEGANGKFFELDKAGHLVWEYINLLSKDKYLDPKQKVLDNEVFKASFYESNYEGLKDKSLKTKKKIK